MVSQERHALQIYQTIPVWDMVEEGRKHISTEVQFPPLCMYYQRNSQIFIYQSPVSKQFYSLLLIYMISSDRMV